MRNFLLRLIVFLMVGSAQAYAQTITGTVKDESGDALPGVAIVVKGTTSGTFTNGEGTYAIKANNGDILVFSFIGFANKEVTVTNASVVDVALKSTDTNLNEVIVTALGEKRSPRSLGYAAQKVEGKDLTLAQAPTIAQGLLGKVAGLNISQASGGVEGGSSRLVIRGNTSLTGDNRALIIVDGVAINNDPMNVNGNNSGGGATGTKQGSDVSGYNDWGTGMNFINPEDIEDLTVLKGPAAAALYGARGANGVIVITRKKGQARKGLGVDYSFSTRTTKAYEFLDFQNEYGSGLRSTMASATPAKQFSLNSAGDRIQIGTYNGTDPAHGGLPYPGFSVNTWDVFSWGSGFSWGPKFDNQPMLWYDGVKRPYSAQPNNWKAFFPNGSVNQHNVSISGGGDFGSARFSYTRDDNKANVLNSNFHTNTFTLGSTIRVSKRVSADMTASYINYERLNTPPVGAGSYLAGMSYAMTRDYMPEVEKMNNFAADGSQRDVGNSSNFPAGSPAYPYYSYMQNVFWNTYKNNTVFARNQLIGGARITADVTDWLNVTLQGGIDNSSDGTTVKEYPKNIQGTTGAYKEAMSRSFNRNMSALVRLHKQNIFTEKLNASITGGAESYYRNDYTVSNATSGNFIKPFIFALDNGANTPSAANEIRYAKEINSVYGYLDLSYANNLFLQVTGRKDWSSTLPAGSNSYFYPSANLSYVFLDGIPSLQTALPWLSFGKVSVSYAETGSDTDPYSIHNVITTAAYNGQASQTYPSTLKFPGIEPQRSRSYELGLNLGFFQNKVNLELSLYSMKTYNQILTNPLPISSGFSSIQLNKGSLGNKGIEFTINATPISTGDFSWKVSLNGANSSTTVLALDEGIEDLQLGSFFGSNGITQRVKVGDKYGTLYGRDFTYYNGQRIVERSTDNSGKVITYGDGIVAGTKWKLTDGEVPIGNSQPFLTGGIGNTFRYKDFSLFAMVDGKFGGDTYLGTYSAAMGNGLLQETVKERNGGGLPVTYPDGTTANQGINFGGVFVTRDAQGNITSSTPNTDVVSYHWYYLGTYSTWNNVGVPRSASVYKNSWMKLREVALTYQVPKRFVEKTKVLQNLSVSLIGRDLFYIFTTIPKGLNPEGVNGIGNMQGIEYSSMPRIRSYGFSIKTSL